MIREELAVVGWHDFRRIGKIAVEIYPKNYKLISITL